MGQGALARLRAAGGALRDALRQTHAARLASMAARLRRPLPLLALLVLMTLGLCLYLGWSSARGVFLVLLPASPSGVGAGIASGIVALAVLELGAAFAFTLIGAALQLAYDTGRHRIRALLVMASGLGLAAMARHLAAEGPEGIGPAILPILGLGGLMALTIWFERAYRRPAYPGFRDFWVDVVEARHYLLRAAHGE